MCLVPQGGALRVTKLIRPISNESFIGKFDEATISV